MNDEVVIQVENLGKKYRLGQRSNERYVALRDVIAEKMKAPFHFLRRSKLADRSSAQSPRASRDQSPISHLPSPASSPSTISDLPSSTTSPHRASNPEYLWALRDVNFEVRRGEVVGIIGRNGAGKSTLLKILSRITDPTEGRVRLKGRVGSLLEVGTGFHPELTGRENIFLNGAILGMTRVEIKSKFDEIVDFAEIEKFLDTPVKRYSSGMYVRLAFAVAAHLEPEILVVDEVLAVGDVQFQKKCLGKMEQVSRGGRTVLFVSHQMAAVQNLCQRGILLDQGRITHSGPIAEIISHYISRIDHDHEQLLSNRKDRQGNGVLQFEAVLLTDGQARSLNALTCGAPAAFELLVRNQSGHKLKSLRIGFGIDTEAGERIAVLATHLAKEDFAIVPADIRIIRIDLPRLPLAAGRYRYTLFASVNGEIADWIKHAGTFDVEAGDFFGTGQLPPNGQGRFLIDHSFVLSNETSALASNSE